VNNLKIELLHFINSISEQELKSNPKLKRYLSGLVRKLKKGVVQDQERMQILKYINHKMLLDQ